MCNKSLVLSLVWVQRHLACKCETDGYVLLEGSHDGVRW